MEITYPARAVEQDGGYFVEFIDLPDTFTEGETLDAALFNAAEVLSGMLAWRLDGAQDIPLPTPKLEGVHYVAPDHKTQAALLRQTWAG